ncbi:MAG: metal-dependent transcriptional regulator [Gemmatimonadota bacterium]
MTTRALSRSEEDYLKAIYGLSESGDPASTTAIATVLDIQPASVTGMIKRMAESGLLEHIPYRGVRLTDRGTLEALQVLRRHRILETYLCERLGFSWDDVHAEAERLEHAASDRLIERMAAALEFPSYDPHGAPIPTKGGKIEPTDPATLADARLGERLRIRAVRDEDAETLRSVAEAGLLPGVRVEITDHTPGEGVIGVSFGADRRVRSIGNELARQIYVVPDEG